MCLYICVGHRVVIVFYSPWYRPGSVFSSFSSTLVSCNYVRNLLYTDIKKFYSGMERVMPKDDC